MSVSEARKLVWCCDALYMEGCGIGPMPRELLREALLLVPQDFLDMHSTLVEELQRSADAVE
jgi:hypothetical protein